MALMVINDILKIDIANRIPLSINKVDLNIIDTNYSLDKEVSSYLNESNRYFGNFIKLIVEDTFGLDILKY